MNAGALKFQGMKRFLDSGLRRNDAH